MTGGGKGGGAVFPVLAAALLGALALSAATGPVSISPRAAFDAIFRGTDDTPARVLLSLRLPRALLGALVGGALASSGVAFQALLRNPLADPYILGVSGGAAVGALTVALFLSADASPSFRCAPSPGRRFPPWSSSSSPAAGAASPRSG